MLHRTNRLRSRLVLPLCALVCTIASPLIAEGRTVALRADAFTEGAAIPFTRLTGSGFNPGAALGLEWRWLEREILTVYQTGYATGFLHGTVERGLLVGTEVGLRATARFGLAVELGVGAAYMHAFSASPVYRKDESGGYVQVRDWGRPRFSPTTALGIGFDFSRVSSLPLAVFVQYGSFSEIPYSRTQFPVLPHVTLGMSVRHTLRWSAP